MTGDRGSAPVPADLSVTPRMPGPAQDPAGSMRPRVLAAIGICLAVVAAVAFLGARTRSLPASGAVAIALVDQPASGSAGCRTLESALSDDLAGHVRRPLEGQTEGVAAWGDPPIVLRCGLTDPAELTCSAALIDVSGVQWLQRSDIGQTTYLAADRQVRIALTLPDGSGTGPIQQISEIVAQVLPGRPVCDGNGVLTPATG